MNEISTRVVVRYRDLDPMGHANFASYLSYFEEVLNKLWGEVLSKVGMRLTPCELNYVTARIEVDYKKPAFLGEDLKAKIWVLDVGSRSFTTAYQLTQAQTYDLIATAKSVQVVQLPGMDKEPIPENIRAALSQFQISGGPKGDTR